MAHSFQEEHCNLRNLQKEFKNKIGHGIVPEICLHKVNIGVHTVINSLFNSDVLKPGASLKPTIGTGQQPPSPM
jgi:hypothetical protein